MVQEQIAITVIGVFSLNHFWSASHLKIFTYSFFFSSKGTWLCL